MDCGEFGRMPAEAEDKDFAPLPEDDEALEPCPRVRDVRIGRANSTLSVRIVSFLIDNNIFHRLNPQSFSIFWAMSSHSASAGSTAGPGASVSCF